ncbi:MAG: FHA domain-containing protein [Planctomycetes bacterium]|nr:FHA domain-containing protein [Planctomycetota bacterium]
MAKRKPGDDFSSDDVAKPTSEAMVPTRKSGVQAGLEETVGTETLFHAIVTDIFNIGRDPECNLVIRKDTKTSRKHATITRQGMAYVLEDNGSSNGTIVNGEKIKGAYELKVGDNVKIGHREFVFARRTGSE